MQQASQAVLEPIGQRIVEVVQDGPACFVVKLEGAFRTGWLASVCAGLSSRQVAIFRAEASSRDGWWSAELGIIPPRGLDPRQLPYAALVDGAADPASGTLGINRYSVSACEEFGGTLKVEITARDSLGLLGKLLSRLAMISLFPAAMHITTNDGRARDVFWLTGIGGGYPTTVSRAVLVRMLAAGADDPKSSMLPPPRTAAELERGRTRVKAPALLPSIGRFEVDDTAQRGVILVELAGTLSIRELREFASTLEAAIERTRGAAYRIFCDSRNLSPLSPEAASYLLTVKGFSASRPNFQGSAVWVASPLIALQHRRTSAAGGVIESELISDDERACWDFLDRVSRATEP